MILCVRKSLIFFLWFRLRSLNCFFFFCSTIVAGTAPQADPRGGLHGADHRTHGRQQQRGHPLLQGARGGRGVTEALRAGRVRSHFEGPCGQTTTTQPTTAATATATAAATCYEHQR